MAEKKITPKAPAAKAEEKTEKSAAARVTKRHVIKRHVIKRHVIK